MRFSVVVLITWFSALLVSAQYTLAPGLYDNRAPIFTMAGSFTIQANPAHYLGDIAVWEAGSSVSFNTNGDGFVLFIYRSILGGDGQVCIDGVCSNLSWFAPADEYQVPIEFSNLGAGVHTVEVLQSSGSINFDAVLIHPQAEVTATPAPEATEDPRFVRWEIDDGSGTVQPVVFEYRVDAGQVTLIQMVGGLLVLGLIFLLLTLWRIFNARD